MGDIKIGEVDGDQRKVGNCVDDGAMPSPERMRGKWGEEKKQDED